jgi:hypothetical protein
MKKFHMIIILSFFLVSCATVPFDRYNTQKGAAIGAGAGALIGQAIGGNTESTLIGMAAGTIMGALVGNAVDQDIQAAKDAAAYGKRVIYYDKSGRAVEAIPEGTNPPHCQKVRKRIWENGELVKETVEEVCGPSAPVVRYVTPPEPPPVYYYGWWGWPVVPGVSLYYGRPRSHGYPRYHGHRHYRGRHFW